MPAVQALEQRVLMATSSLAAVADAGVRDGANAGRNYGADTSLPVQRAAAGFQRQGYVRFTVSGVQGNVTRAVLRLYGRYSASGSATAVVNVQAVGSTTWGERTITWNNRPAAGAVVGTARFGTSYRWVDVDVTAHVAKARAEKATVVSFALVGSATTPAQVLVNARESGSLRPTLVLTTGTVQPPPPPPPVPPPPPAPPEAVAGLSAGLSVSGAPVLNWSPAARATSYDVLRRVGDGQPVRVGSNLTTAAFTDVSAKSDTLYRYTVVGRNAGGVGAASTTVLIATPTPPAPNAGAPLSFAAGASTGMSVFYLGGDVTFPDGSVVTVQPGVVTLDSPEVVSQVYRSTAPGNYAGQLFDRRWPDQAANLVPPVDTTVLGGPYRMVLGDSVVVRSGDGSRTFVAGTDYQLNVEWGQVANVAGRLGAPGTGTVQISYQIALQRLDLIQVLPDGTVGVKRGRSVPVCPELPAPDAGAVALAGVHVNTMEGARRIDFYVKQRDVLPIRPLPPVPPINPSALTKALAKLSAGGTVNVAFFGDSITEGAEATNWVNDRSRTYTSLVSNGIRSRYAGATVVETMAHKNGVSATAGGTTWKNLVMTPHLAGKTVDLVVIAMGMNDLGKPSLDPYKNALRGYIAEARAAGIEVLLVTPIQSNPYYDSVYTDWVPRGVIAQAMRDVAAETGVACADAHQAWLDQASRGIAPVSQLHNWFNHPGNAGMRVIADAILGHFPGPSVEPPPG